MLPNENQDFQLAEPDGDESLLRLGMKFAHLRMIVALDEHGQIGAAGQAMNLSQPAASRMVAEIEDILGVPLCERLHRGVRLTPYGLALARRARIVLLEIREASREIASLKAGRAGTVSVGCVTAPALDLAVPAIKELRARFPTMEINVQVETSAVLIRELIAERHDFVLGRIPEDLNPKLFRSRVIGVERACLIVRRGHPLLEGEIDLMRLRTYDWVLQPSGSLLRRTIETMFMERNIEPPDRILHTSSMLLTLAMIAQSDSVAPVSIPVAKLMEDLGSSIEVLALPFGIDIRPYSLIVLRNRSLSPVSQMLHDRILDLAG